ncbi:MAG: NAD(P)-dependent alcohol dehydrogenase, partial [Candidatus Melainabacteria bacterium]|jgi:NADPH:quinone reductase-like Zn-dependent oxidoreductase|nr:NAD(P)-dependent alcohol dehydrogenase [Candidatus Melainabacteria bacterium]
MVTAPTKTDIEYAAFELRNFSIDAIRATKRTTPKIGPLDVLVRMKAASLNYRDILVSTGVYNPGIPLPRIPLSDGAGEVVEVGSSVTRFKVGDRVSPNFMTEWLAGKINATVKSSDLGGTIDGVLRELAVFNERSLVRIPEHLSYAEAATLPCAAVTAWNGLVENGGLRAGETVLVMGTGGVSIFALQIAHLFGAEVIATTSSDDKMKHLKKLGASHVINYKKTPDWEKEVVKYTCGRGVDHVVEIGGAGTLAKSAISVKLGGHISLIGVLADAGQKSNFEISLLMKAVKLQGVFVGSVEMFERMNAAISLHKMKPVIDKSFKANQIVEALKYQQSGAHFGKIVITI